MPRRTGNLSFHHKKKRNKNSVQLVQKTCLAMQMNKIKKHSRFKCKKQNKTRY